MNFDKRARLAVVLAGLLMTAGCGGGDSSGPGTNEPNNPGQTGVKVSGKVADGYIAGATVCLDKNGNKVCDSGEPSATTGADGAFEITGVAEADRNAYPLLVEVPASATDSDNPGVPVGKSYLMSAPAGKTDFVSPLTTMIQARIEANPALTVDAAEAAVMVELGYSAESGISLFDDFVAAAADDNNAAQEEYARVHNVARVAAQVMMNNVEAVTDAAVNAGLDPVAVMDELLAIIVREVIEQLAEIATSVDAAGENFDAAAAEAIAAATVGSIDTSNIADDVAKEELLNDVQLADMQAVFAGGMNLSEAEDSESVEVPDFYWYSRISVDAENNLVGAGHYYDVLSKAWVEDMEDSNDECTWLTAEGWKTQPCNAAESVSFGTDHTATISNGRDVSVVSAISVDVTGKSIIDVLDGGWSQAIPDTALFSSGATAYLVTVTQEGDLYDIGYFNPVDGADCGTFIPALAGTTNCNVVWENGMAVTGSTDADLSKLTESSAVYEIGEAFGVKFLADGVAEFYLDNVAQETTGTWQVTAPIAGGPEILMVNVPVALRENTWEPEDSMKIFFAVHDGFVRPGWYSPDGAVEEFMALNDVAMQDVLDNFTYEWTGGGEMPASEVAGVWRATNGEEFNYLVLFDDGSFMYAENDLTVESPEENGLEAGAYFYDTEAGTLNLFIAYDDNGPGLASGLGEFGESAAEIVLSNGGATMTVAGLALDAVDFTSESPVVGAWRAESEQGFNYLLLFADNTFAYAEYDAMAAEEQNGLEAGTYSYDSVAGTITFDISYDDRGPGLDIGIGDIGTPVELDANLSNGNATLSIAGGQVELQRAY